jgi:hypothetical protein
MPPIMPPLSDLSISLNQGRLDDALVEAVERRDVAAAQHALRRGASADARQHPWRKFHPTLEQRFFLLRSKLLHPLRVQDRPVLSVAAHNNDIAMVRTLLAHKPDVNAPDQFGATPLMLAASRVKGEDVALVRLLLDSGAQVNRRDMFGRTALTYAQMSHSTAAVGLINKAGGKP